MTRTRGVVSAEVLFTSDLLKLKVRYCPQYLPAGRIFDRVACYRASEAAEANAAANAERRDLLLRTGAADLPHRAAESVLGVRL